MHKKFDNQAIEKKWQERWEKEGLYDVGNRKHSKEKEYVLVEWPYPSGNLHIGHWHAFAVPDIYARFMRMSGKQVLYPIGFDAFGLPAENAAIKRDVDPKAWTEGNIAHMKEQLRSMGASFSWDKTTSSTDEDYYRWTQWMFTEFFKNDIAFRGKGIVNWCPFDNTVIANEQVLADGTCERCGHMIEKREMPQWMLRITKYADRLVDDLDALSWPEQIKEAQRQWIGRSKGAEIDFSLSTGGSLTVFTTRPDTLFGVTYVVVAPEHELISKCKNTITNFTDVDAYVSAARQKDEQDRLDATKEKTGVKLEGITAKNPANGEELPIYVADYVLGGYGTGAIMAVPAHDERDFAFAKKFDLPIKEVVAECVMGIGERAPRSEDGIVKFRAATVLLKHWAEEKFYVVEFSPTHTGLIGGHVEDEESIEETARREATEESGYTDIKKITRLVEYQFGRGYKERKQREELCVDSFFVVELDSDSRIPIIDHETKAGSWKTKEEIITDKNFAEHHKNFFEKYLYGTLFSGSGRLVNSGEFDGMDSEEAKEAIVKKVGGRMTSTYRLRDWSVGRQRYWGVPIPIVYDPQGNAHPIPLEHLPWKLPEDVDFRPTGVPPLAKSEELKKRTEAIFGEGWTPEVETLDTFVDSSWYFLRYIDNKDETSFSSMEEQKEWMPIDIYFGGAEHTTMHLLYSRFWQKALFDLGYVKDSEPYTHRINRGLILGPDGNKMSKSKGNVIDPDDHVKTVGADSVKMYLAFMGPYGETSNYPWDMGGIAGIRRFLERVYGLDEHIVEEEKPSMTQLLHKTIAKVRSDIPQYKFNTAISAMMIYLNNAEKEGLSQESYRLFLRLLAPFAAFLTEELWEKQGSSASIHTEAYPLADEEMLKESEVVLGMQINGKTRGSVKVAQDAAEADVVAIIKADLKLSRYLNGEIVKVIYVPKRVINFIVKTN